MIQALRQYDEVLMTRSRPGETLDIGSVKSSDAKSARRGTHRHHAGDHDGPLAVLVPPGETRSTGDVACRTDDAPARWSAGCRWDG